MREKEELEVLINEYDPANSDWGFRKGVMLDVLSRLPAPAQAPGACPLCGGELEQGKQRYCPSCGTHEPDEAPAQAAPAQGAVKLDHGMNCPALGSYSNDGCTCGLRYRIELQTEREMHAAWRKRAEEAEAALSSVSSTNQPATAEHAEVRAALEPVAWQYRVMFNASHVRHDEWCAWRDASKRYFDKINAEIPAGATRVQTRVLYALPQSSSEQSRPEDK